MTDPRNPKFYLYYSTVHGDILGQLVLSDYEIIFDPLNEQFKGIYSYENGDLLTNHKVGFILDYNDIVGDILKISMPEDESDPSNQSKTFDLQISLKHTGN